MYFSQSSRRTEKRYLQGMNIGGCLACEGCQRNGGSCVQNDDMQIVIDRLYAVLFGAHIEKQFVVIMTARGNMYEMTEDFFSIFTRFLGWKNLGNALGAGKEEINNWKRVKKNKGFESWAFQ